MSARSAIPILLLCFILPASAQAPTKYEVIVPGLVANPTYVLQFRSDDLRLEVRDLIMGPGQARNIPTPARAMMELRGGTVITTINGRATPRIQGDIWSIAKGDSLSLENLHDVVVIRSMSIIERGQ
jgi:hypothetical protein